MEPTASRPKRKRYLRYAGIALAVILVVTVVGAVIWVGFTQEVKTTSVETSDVTPGTKTTTEVHYRTLWDLLQLLFVPLVLGLVLSFAAWWLSERRANTDRQISEDRLREETLQSYLYTMTELLLDKGLGESDESDKVRVVARARTLTVLRRLDGTRKGLVMRFLDESGLIHSEREIDTSKIAVVVVHEADPSGADLRKVASKIAVVDLSEADLSGADLSWANLSGAKLCGADLRGADLRGAGLMLADLRGVKLEGANLRGTELHEADLRGAHLRGVDLHGDMLAGAKLRVADLSGANLSEATLSWADLSWANLEGANLREAIYDNATKWPDGFDPVAAGARNDDQNLPNEVNTDESKPA